VPYVIPIHFPDGSQDGVSLWNVASARLRPPSAAITATDVR
jgi:hypothetical protein